MKDTREPFDTIRRPHPLDTEVHRPSRSAEPPTAPARDREWTWHAEHVIPSEATAGKQILEELLCKLRAAHWVERDVFSIHLAMEEALMNAIKHGNRYDTNKCVHVAYRLADDLVRIDVTDQGPGFDPTSVPDCTDPENLEVCSGRGVLLMKSFMSLVEYNPQGNSVRLEKCREMAAAG